MLFNATLLPAMPDTPRKIDAVFEGGGVKGTAFVGAIEVAESRGFTFANIAGTSAGAIVASLIAAGYTSAEIKPIMDGLNYRKFQDKGWIDSIPYIGPLLSLLFQKGIYEGRYVETLIRDLLAKKGVRTFGDLKIAGEEDPRYRYKLQVVASDISRGRMLVLPMDAPQLGIDPDQLEVAKAVRMSMSIPLFFEPVMVSGGIHGTSTIVDGGVLSNYPVFLFDDGTPNPAWPTIGFKLVEPEEGKPYNISGPLSLLYALFATMMEAHDARYIETANFVRTIPIPTMGVRSTDFDLSLAQREALYVSGKTAATEFFDRWDFEEYKRLYRAGEKVHRTEMVWGEKR